ncbi:MAG: SDR family oxidoreductase [Alphaproteobacteria bacterium]|nr:SDR family oxidoreductase [Alphaproteobacteria bacterium]
MTADRGALLVTGGGRGIGAATARAAARAGWTVCIGYAGNHAAAARVVADITDAGGRAEAVQGDVAVEADVLRVFDECERRLGPLGGLVNNAGITGPIGRVADVSAATLDAVFRTNVLGAFLCAREAVRRMSTARGGRGGVIVNVSSGAATRGSANEFVWYAASKGAVDSLTVGLAREVAGEGIRVLGIAPGLTETELHAAAGEPGRVARMQGLVPLGRAASAEEVAGQILFLLSDAAAYCHGATLRATGGL